MSNFVHKVKDAITDHDKPVTRSQAHPSDDRTHSAGNPFTPSYNNRQNAPRMDNPVNRDPNFNRTDDGSGSLASNPKSQDNQYTNYPTSTVTESQPSSYNRNTSSSVPEDSSSSASSDDINAGPHSSKVANKLDPRVDSDLGTGTGTQNLNPSNMQAQKQQSQNQGMNPSNMPAQKQQFQNQGMNPSNMPAQQQQQPFTQGQGQGQGLDNHTSTEDNFNKSTQEHHSQQRQPGFNSNPNLGQMGENQEENFSTSTQENKSHKSTSHVAPCTTAGGAGAGAGEPMAQNTANTAQPLDNSGFGGNAAAGGSSNLNMGAGAGAPQDLQGKAQALGQGQGQGLGHGQGQGEYTTPRQKFNADANRPAQQESISRDQRGGF
ncbi:hypothetical protein N7481_006574 [Penicillium waksmanii]|uniref:uncharacterized protein n=1 Tax=Penicillium waksmanii TaxID=69791 RepID=UPI002549A2F5|nr:uncharacterized protein N7481_006574 [Penicillium waksmanii]KAJ5984475.1 hypothetical protein N7481_006574 [Penicillium waksmanii]